VTSFAAPLVEIGTAARTGGAPMAHQRCATSRTTQLVLR